MAAGIKLSQESVTQTLDLNDLVGEDISDDEELVLKISQAIIDYTLDRAGDGKGLGGVRLSPGYSKEYKESDEFKAAGKSNTVNMRLSGDMLGSIDVISVDGSEITYGITDGSEAPKAYGHQTGYRGHPTIPQGEYVRPFFGITKEEFKKHILKEFKGDIEAKSVTSAQGINRVISSIRNVRTLEDLLEFEDEN